MKTNGNDNLRVPQHVESEDLVAYLDGELSRDVTLGVRRHLESCWDCRNRLTAVERSIEKFLDLRRELLIPNELPPSGPAVDLFRNRLAAHQALTPTQSFFRKLSIRASSFVNVSGYSLRTQVLLVRAVAAVAIISVVTAFVLFSGRFNTVSASDLLRLTAEAEAGELARTNEPVIRQRLTIKSTRSSEPVSFEIWNDTQNGRARVSVPGVAGILAIANRKSQIANHSDATLTDLRSTLKLNNMNQHRPLSAVSYRSWSESLTNKDEVVTADKDMLTITTTPGGNISIGHITSAQLAIRAAGYHPQSLTLSVRAIDGDVTFELTENEYQIASLKDIDPSIFANASQIEPATTARVSEPGAVATGSNTNTEPEMAASTAPSNTSVATTSSPIASLNTEVEVVKLLDSVGALSGDQINITRTGGKLRVAGIVDTAQRKNEIIGVLGPVRRSPGLIIEIQTAAEVASRQKESAGNPSAISVDTMRAEVEQLLPAEPEIRAHLGRRGVGADRMNAEVMSFANSVLDRSRSLRRNALSLKQIATRFSPAELEKLDPPKQAEWRSLMRSKAAAISSDIRSLESQLASAGLGSPAGRGGAEQVSAAAVAQRLFDLAAACDQSVSQSFTISSAGNVAVKNAQFWRNLAQMAAIAEGIQKK